MRRIPAAEFQMGSPIADDMSFAYRKCERPQHAVTVDEFWIGRYLVTAEEFCLFLNHVGNDGYFTEETGWIDWRTITKTGETYSPMRPETRMPTRRRNEGGPFVPQPGAERCPALPVTWIGAVRYCEWLSEKLGHEFRLPTEAEWELTARGPELREWPWGSEVPLREYGPAGPPVQYFRREASKPNPPFRLADPIDARIPFYDLRGERWMYRGPFDKNRPWTKVPVGSFPLNATPEGVYDMLGYYVGQWCADVYDEAAYERAQSSAGDSARTAAALHVRRGRYAAPVDRDIFFRKTPFLLRLLMGDAGGGTYTMTAGRSWSRFRENPQRSGAFFRVASSKAPGARDKP